MPGYPGYETRDARIILRVAKSTKATWARYAHHAGISQLIRDAVREYIELHKPDKNGEGPRLPYRA